MDDHDGPEGSRLTWDQVYAIHARKAKNQKSKKTKKCRKCKVTKSKSDFAKFKSAKNGQTYRRNTCKPCNNVVRERSRRHEPGYWHF